MREAQFADFEQWPLEAATGEQALRGFLSRGGALRVLVSRPDWLERRASRFMRVRRAHAAQVECRQLPASLRVDDCALVADGQHLVWRAHCDTFHGRLALASPSAVETLVERYQAAWDESTPCLAATTLGL